MDPGRRWLELMQRRDDQIPLDEGALLIAAHANPALDILAQLKRLDHLAAEVRAADISELCEVLFDKVGLQGDKDTYDDPVNSYIDRVLDRRRGIPISLSVVLIEVGRRCGLRLEGVGMPGHFLVRDPASPQLLIDSFDRGRRLDQAGCQRLFQAVTGSRSPLTPELLVATGTRGILARMLANLDRSFERRGDRRSLRWVASLRMGIPDRAPADRVQLANRLNTLGRFDAAADVLDDLARSQPSADRSARLRGQALGLRARLN